MHPLLKKILDPLQDPDPEMIPNKVVPSFLLKRLIYGQKLIVLSCVYRLKAILSKIKKHDQYLTIQ